MDADSGPALLDHVGHRRTGQPASPL